MNHHTPGPWVAELDVITRIGGPRIRSKGLGIADLWEVEGFGGSAKANAKLIAAAPDMLEALKIVLAFMPAGKSIFKNIEKAKEQAIKAIAKAQMP